MRIGDSGAFARIEDARGIDAPPGVIHSALFRFSEKRLVFSKFWLDRTEIRECTIGTADLNVRLVYINQFINMSTFTRHI